MYALDGVPSVLLHAPVTFGELLREARARRGMTQAELARLLGVQQQAVTRWENDRDRPRPETVRVIARELGLTGTEVAVSLGYVDDPGQAQAEEFRLPRGVKLSDLEPHERDTLVKIMDVYLDSVLRDESER